MSTIDKLRQTSLDELRVRGSQALAVYSERLGWSRSTRLISDRELLDLLRTSNKQFGSTRDLLSHFRERRSPGYFPVFDDRTGTVEEFNRRWPGSAQKLIERADKIGEGCFSLLGFSELNFGKPIDWLFEPVAGKRVPLVHWSRFNNLDDQLSGDKKIVWELNRHQHFATLGQAYWLTGDVKYATIFVDQINGWIDQNPPKLGINWSSSLEVAFRSLSWLWALYFFKEAEALDDATFARITKFLYLNALHLETFLSTYYSPNTHLTGEALGLFFIGSIFPEFKDAKRWRDTGLEILTEQLDKQVQPDGIYFEQTSYYHRYTTDFYLHLKISLMLNGEPFPSKLDTKLQQLVDHLMYITRPDGTSPLFGDDDGGKLVKLEHRRANDFRATLSTAAAVFKRADYKFVAGGPAEETLWLLGSKAIRELDELRHSEPSKTSMGFETGGYYVMRDGWNLNSNYLLFDCGPHGVFNCGHAHADALSYVLSANGKSFLDDPGTFTYTTSKGMRDWFRSSAAHNTLTIDGQSWSNPAGPFSWQSISSCEKSKWLAKDRFDYVVGTVTGPSLVGLQHRRAILFLKNDYWIVCDRAVFSGTHEVKTWFHLDPGVEAQTSDANVVEVAEGHDFSLKMAIFAGKGSWNRETGWVSHCYGVKEDAPVLAYSTHVSETAELITFLVPQSSASVPAAINEIKAADGRAFEVDRDACHDVLLCSGGSAGNRRVETQRLVSNFSLAWVRFKNEDAVVPDEFVLIDGNLLQLDGRALVKSKKRIGYLAAKRVGDSFSIETDDRSQELSLPIEILESSNSSLR
ncbi:MAG TPA: alginate lyase family protein [Pyrinomonadaceae bacterium]|jgi:Uncharacterized protein conserved in bacteria|nr:alginate lyase family protein [Pyrinomonadaceae bacterium]